MSEKKKRGLLSVVADCSENNGIWYGISGDEECMIGGKDETFGFPMIITTPAKQKIEGHDCNRPWIEIQKKHGAGWYLVEGAEEFSECFIDRYGAKIVLYSDGKVFVDGEFEKILSDIGENKNHLTKEKAERILKLMSFQ